MKIKGFIISGIILSILGIGITAVASTQIDFDNEFVGAFDDPNLEQKEQTFGEITRVIYDASTEGIEIVYGEGDNTLTYWESKRITYEITYDEDTKTLSIEQDYKFSFFNFSIRNTKARLLLNSNLEEVEIDSSAGSVSIRGMTIGKADIEVSAGSVKLEDSSISNLKIDSSAGSVSLQDTTVDTSHFELSAGSLSMKDCSITEATIHSSAGGVSLKDTNFSVIDAHLSAGSLTLIGDILTQGKFKLSAGSLKMTLARSKECYTVNG
ncbi:MAG: DUF4097 domain-containing protein, partial [Anaeroplasmataceae bacterium]|nr:DUF4097 domain-containing protein [Anaeroplasmataceae bacterium]